MADIRGKTRESFGANGDFVTTGNMQMTRLSLFAIAACTTLAASPAFSIEQTSTKASVSPRALQASASYNPAADAIGNRYDSSCLAIAAKHSRDYDNCLQKLPAHTMVGRGGY